MNGYKNMKRFSIFVSLAAVAFAAVLFKIVRSPAVQDALTNIVTSALNVTL